MNTIELQDRYFHNPIKRMGLLPPKSQKAQTHDSQKNILVIRNQVFEIYQNIFKSFFDAHEINCNFTLSNYSDFLSEHENYSGYDAYLIWYDFSRISDPTAWKIVCKQLNNLSCQPNITACIFTDDAKKIATLACQSNASFHKFVCKGDGSSEQVYSPEEESLTSSPVSDKFALSILPTILCDCLPKLKDFDIRGVIVDLDNTLYDGVLGEDGIHGLHYSPAHVQLMGALNELYKNGIFVCLCSKNDADTVTKWLQSSCNPMSIENLTLVEASWDLKSNMVTNILKALNISGSNVAFIDDNPAELYEVLAKHEGITPILAGKNTNNTKRYLGAFINVNRPKSKTDLIRNADTKANQQRQRLDGNSSPEALLRKLQVNIRIYTNFAEHRARSLELSNKTNQFKLNSFRPITLGEVPESEILEYDVITFSVADKFSDSGVTASLIAKCCADRLEVIDFCISCRVLGRHLEDVFFDLALERICSRSRLRDVSLTYERSTRNTPARLWLERYFDMDLSHQKNYKFDITNFKSKSSLLINEVKYSYE